MATPIGNLGDITLRALWLLQQADVILCEDTRVTAQLMRSFGLHVPLVSCHDHNEAGRIAEVLSRLARDEVVVLVSDAGTPLLSDPGFRLVRACREAGHPITAAPGASALLAALVCAGLPTDRFLFAGFLPAKAKARRDELAKLAAQQATLVFYESPQRLADSLAAMAETLSPDRPAAIGRELTKLYEEFRTGTLAELAQAYGQEPAPKGEIVILVAPPSAPQEASAESVDALLRDALETLSLRDAVALVTEQTGSKKSDIYQRALALQAGG